MEEVQRIFISVARIEEKLDNMDDRFDKIEQVLRDIRDEAKQRHKDHEDRIRDLEKTSNTLCGKLMVISASASAGIAAFIAWFTQSGGHT